jgi:hypothetical protein
MTADESRVFVRLFEFSLHQADLLSVLTSTVFQWMDNQESMQSLRDEMVKKLAEGDKSPEVLAILSRLCELTQESCSTRFAKSKDLYDALAKAKSERDVWAATVADWKRSLNLQKNPGS